ncbi:MAG: TonB-dependent receptor family protein [Mediterranea sp.]|nr:TonB-dependent receptor family protein [Mediterranea sp.]
MKKILLSLLLLAIGMAGNHLCAQETHGHVMADEDGLPITNATVVMQTPDSAYVGAAITDSVGSFRIAASLSSYRLIVQHLLYETTEQTFEHTEQPVVRLKERNNALGEVTVQAQHPLVRLTEGRIAYDMPRLLERKAVSNVYEALLQLPGIREQDGTLVLAGATGVTLLLNGQATSMPAESLIALLKSLPYTRMQRAEVMYSAPPQYHVRGAAINIVLTGKQESDSGLQGEVNGTYAQKHYANYTAGTALRYATGKLSADLNYAYTLNRAKNDLSLYSHHQYNGTTHDIEQLNLGDKRANDHNLRLALEYAFSKREKLSAAYTAQLSTGIRSNQLSAGTLSHSTNHKVNAVPTAMHNLLLDYTSGFGLKAGVEYTRYRERTDQHFQESLTERADTFTARSTQNVDSYRLYADQSHTLGTWTLNYGAQYTYATDHSTQHYLPETRQDLSAQDTDSRLREQTANLYAGFETAVGDKLSLSASLTGEYYRYGNYKEWSTFPTLEATYAPATGHIVQLSVSSDKAYPDYWELHGGTSYLNGYALIEGNPQLRPCRTYEGQLSYIFKGKYILTAYYSYLDHYFVQLPYQSPAGPTLVYQTLNFNYKQTVGLNLILPFGIGRVLNSQLTLNGFYDNVKSDHFHDLSFHKDNWVFYARLSNTFRLSAKPAISLELSGAYITRNIQGPEVLSRLWSIDAGLKCTLLKGNGELCLKGTDLSNSWSPDMRMRYATQDLWMQIRPDSRAVSLSFTWRFGGFKGGKQQASGPSRFGTK